MLNGGNMWYGTRNVPQEELLSVFIFSFNLESLSYQLVNIKLQFGSIPISLNRRK